MVHFAASSQLLGNEWRPEAVLGGMSHCTPCLIWFRRTTWPNGITAGLQSFCGSPVSTAPRNSPG